MRTLDVPSTVGRHFALKILCFVFEMVALCCFVDNIRLKSTALYGVIC